jgi:hypothetical protein
MTAQEMEHYISNLIDAVAESIDQAFPELIALVLVGSYGRGEGAIRRGEAGYELSNDLDFVLVFDGKPSAALRARIRQEAQEISSKHAVRHVDLIAMSKAELHASPPSMLRVDMREAGRLLFGPEELLRSIPSTAPEPFPREELRNLLINRMVTIIEGHPDVSNGLALETKARQVAKVFFALADTILFQLGEYETRYSRKREEIERLAADHEDAKSLSPFISWAFNAMMLAIPESKLSEDIILDKWEECRARLNRMLVSVAERCDEQSYVGIGDTFPTWRGRRAMQDLFPALIATLKGKEIRRSIEQQLARSLAEYERTPTWKAEAERLVRAWYNS